MTTLLYILAVVGAMTVIGLALFYLLARPVLNGPDYPPPPGHQDPLTDDEIVDAVKDIPMGTMNAFNVVRAVEAYRARKESV